MDEVDGILIYTLNHIGCDIGSKISELSPPQLIQCVSRCLQLNKTDLNVPDFDVNVSMSARYKVASQIAQAVTDLGYQDEIGCQSFLYPTEAETRKILIFMVEKLPRDSEVGDQIDNLLSKIAQDKLNDELAEKESIDNMGMGIEIDGIRLPAAVDVDSLPKETLKFYASHLADITFAKQREKYRNKVETTKPKVPEIVQKIEESDDDFGDPDEVIIPEKPEIKEKPTITDKPKLKPIIAEKPKSDKKLKSEEDENELAKTQAAEATIAMHIKTLQENTKTKAKLLKSNEKLLEESKAKVIHLERKIELMKNDIKEKNKTLDRLRKINQLLAGDEDALIKVKDAVSTQMEKLIHLSDQWEQHRIPLIDQIQQRKASSELTEAAKLRDDVQRLKSRLKEMGHEAKSKETHYNQLVLDFDKLPKDLSRSSYTRRIGEIIANIKKQKKEIAKVLNDTKQIQKDINTLAGRLDRTFAVADELIFKDAEKDKNVAQSYKLLVTIHSDFSRIIKTLEEVGNLKRQQRDLEDKLELERGKSIEEKLNRLKADMTQMQHENRILEAKLRDPTIIRRS